MPPPDESVIAPEMAADTCAVAGAGNTTIKEWHIAARPQMRLAVCVDVFNVGCPPQSCSVTAQRKTCSLLREDRNKGAPIDRRVISPQLCAVRRVTLYHMKRRFKSTVI